MNTSLIVIEIIEISGQLLEPRDTEGRTAAKALAVFVEKFNEYRRRTGQLRRFDGGANCALLPPSLRADRAAPVAS